MEKDDSAAKRIPTHFDLDSAINDFIPLGEDEWSISTSVFSSVQKPLLLNEAGPSIDRKKMYVSKMHIHGIYELINI